MTNREYHADTRRISKSGLDLIAKSPLHYWDKYINPNREPYKETEAMQIGSATHTALLEPEKFLRDYVAGPDLDRRTSDGKRQWAEFCEQIGARTILKQETYNLIINMRDAALRYPTVQKLLSRGIAEKTLLFDEPNTGAACKCRPDYITHDGWILDYKTTTDAGSYGFGKSCLNYRYHVQSAFYVDGYFYNTGQMPKGFIFIAQEKEPPYAVAVYYVPNEIIHAGRDTYMRDLMVYQECLAANNWPGYPTDVQPLNIPYLKK